MLANWLSLHHLPEIKPYMYISINRLKTSLLPGVYSGFTRGFDCWADCLDVGPASFLLRQGASHHMRYHHIAGEYI